MQLSRPAGCSRGGSRVVRGDPLKVGARARPVPCRVARAQPRRQPTSCPALGPGDGKGPQEPLKKLAREAERHANNLLETLTPKHEYDLADVTLIFCSTLIFMWLAACLYRVYAFCYYSSAAAAAGNGGFFGH